jgi:nucleoside-diphosphate-sugar epimerase
MRVVIAGGHGQIALRLGRLLAERGDVPVGLVRNPDHADDLRERGIEPVLLDLESASVDDVALALEEADATVFAAGAGPGSGVARKDTVDRAAAAMLADAAVREGVRRYVLISSTGVESVRDGAEPEGVDEVFLAYLRAKLAAEDHVRASDLDWTVLRPGRLTDDPGTGRVTLGPDVRRDDVTRDDVATVVAALLDAPETAGTVLELTGGDTPIADAVRASARRPGQAGASSSA